MDYFGSNKKEDNWNMQNLYSCSSFITLESKQLGLIPETMKLPNLKGVLQESWKSIQNTNTEDIKQLMKHSVQQKDDFEPSIDDLWHQWHFDKFSNGKNHLKTISCVSNKTLPLVTSHYHYYQQNSILVVTAWMTV